MRVASRSAISASISPRSTISPSAGSPPRCRMMIPAKVPQPGSPSCGSSCARPSSFRSAAGAMSPSASQLPSARVTKGPALRRFSSAGRRPTSRSRMSLIETMPSVRPKSSATMATCWPFSWKKVSNAEPDICGLTVAASVSWSLIAALPVRARLAQRRLTETTPAKSSGLPWCAGNQVWPERMTRRQFSSSGWRRSIQTILRAGVMMWAAVTRSRSIAPSMMRFSAACS